MIGILLALSVAFLRSLSELASKVFTDVKKTGSLDEYSLVLWARVLSVIVLLPVLFFIEVPELHQSFIFVIILSSIINTITSVTAIKAVKYWDLSLVSPLTAISIPFLLISGYLILWERANLAGMIWVAIIFFGTYFLNISELKNWNIFSPITAIYHNLWARYMFVTAVLWSISSPLDKIWVLEVWALTWMLYTNILVSIFLFLYIIVFKRDIKISHIWQKKHIKKISAITLLWGITIFLQMLALAYTLVVYVIALKRASGMFSVILWAIFYKEKNILIKFISAMIIFAWVLIITILWNI